MEKKNVVTKNEEAVVVDLDQVLESIGLNAEAAKAKRELERLEARREELQEVLDRLAPEADEKRAEAAKLVKKLQGSLTPEAIKMALLTQFKPEISEKGPRQSHKLQDSDKTRILDKIRAAGKEGVQISDVWNAVPNADQKGVQLFVRSLVDDGKLNKVGATRNQRYIYRS